MSFYSFWNMQHTRNISKETLFQIAYKRLPFIILYGFSRNGRQLIFLVYYVLVSFWTNKYVVINSMFVSSTAGFMIYICNFSY